MRVLKTPLILITAIGFTFGLIAGPADASPRTLKVGTHGLDVQHLNERLSSLGYLPASYASSNQYSTATYHGVMAFQKWTGATRDGVAGPQTRSRLKITRRPTPRLKVGGTRTEVLIGKQLLLLVKNNKVTRTIAVSTGKPGYDTPKGSYKIFRKEQVSYSIPYAVNLPWASYYVGGIVI